MSELVVVGSLNMDLVLQVARAPRGGETLVGRELRHVPGGKGANQAVACARLGGDVSMVGRIGNDDFGRRLQAALRDDGVLLEHVGVLEDVATGIAVIVVEDSGENRIVLVPGANGAFAPAHVERSRAAIEQARLVLLQLEVSAATVEHSLEVAVATGTKVLLNPAPAVAVPDSWLPRIDYLIPNEIEASMLSGIEVRDVPSAIAAAQVLLARGVHHVLITLGAQGVLIAEATGTQLIAAPQVQVVDTTAAGDTFCGALAVALVEGRTLNAAAAFAVQAASLSVTRLGAQTSIPYRSEIV